jgi:hypothetical protein
MTNTLEGVLTIKDTDGTLLAIVYNDIKRRSQVFFKVSELGAEEIKNLLDNLMEKSCKQ